MEPTEQMMWRQEAERLASDNNRLEQSCIALQQELAKCKEDLAQARRELAKLRGRSGTAGRNSEAMSTMASRLRDALRE
ncbi:hypothetical protein [Paenibacillus sp. MMS18-CY102]|uniref:hypothetical protein n=1 Tax=Paenibacillus sp. MMS18-CY102 TaxID=2682849 RepID=UPI0013660A2A|nr:hypothetical protein [Paenibacillus sp. MMS18-CY102]MWC30027.1 hypothetical protein [Paenibacillus sp. MMS18-CY102]